MKLETPQQRKSKQSVMSWHIIDINNPGNIQILFDRLNDPKVGVYKQLYDFCEYECFGVRYAILNWIEENTNAKNRKEANNFGNFLFYNHYILAAQPGIKELEESNFYYLASRDKWNGNTSQNFEKNIVYTPRSYLETLDDYEDDTENDILTREVRHELSDVNNDTSLHDLSSSNCSNASTDISMNSFMLDPPSDVASSPFEPWNDVMDGTFISVPKIDTPSTPMPEITRVSTRTSSIRITARSDSDGISVQSPVQTADPTNVIQRANNNTQWIPLNKSSNGALKTSRLTLTRELNELKTSQIWRRSTPTHISTMNKKIVRLSHYRRFKRVL